MGDLITTDVFKEYTIYSTEEYDTFFSKGSEKEVIEFMNSMITDLNKDEEDEYKLSLCTNMQDVLDKAEYCGIRITERDNSKNKIIVSFIEQALKFNHSWIGATQRKCNEGYYTFSIKPLYIDDSDYIIQVICNLMCPSGISDNGIKYVKQYYLNKYAFSNIMDLCKYLVRTTIGYRSPNKHVDYIQF